MKWVREHGTNTAHVLRDDRTLCGISTSVTLMFSVPDGWQGLLTRCQHCMWDLCNLKERDDENAKRLWLETYNLEAGTG